MTEIQTIADKLRLFAAEREWEQFHSPKNLSIALSVEAGELLEEFQWLTEAQSANLGPEKLAKVRDEIADVFNYLVRLSSLLGIDLIQAANDKILTNAQKYPVSKAKGNATKYTDFPK